MRAAARAGRRGGGESGVPWPPLAGRDGAEADGDECEEARPLADEEAEGMLDDAYGAHHGGVGAGGSCAWESMDDDERFLLESPPDW